ncbi:MAG: leucine-rich repeat protein, partial [Clostridia bacterium]
MTIGSSVKSIEYGAFEGCNNLTTITIPKSVTSIGSRIFIYCSGLTAINCEAESQPSGWDAMWLSGCKVKPTFGYTGA